MSTIHETTGQLEQITNNVPAALYNLFIQQQHQQIYFNEEPRDKKKNQQRASKTLERRKTQNTKKGKLG